MPVNPRDPDKARDERSEKEVEVRRGWAEMRVLGEHFWDAPEPQPVMTAEDTQGRWERRADCVWMYTINGDYYLTDQGWVKE